MDVYLHGMLLLTHYTAHWSIAQHAIAREQPDLKLTVAYGSLTIA